MFDSIEKLNSIFNRYSDGFTASVIECNRELLTELVQTAASSNYWVSKYAMEILINGIDQDIIYFELLTVNDWAILLNGEYSYKLPFDNIDYVYGWVLDLINIDSNDNLLLEYFKKYSNNIQAIMACDRYINRIERLIPNFDINIWKYLVQVPLGKQLAIDSLNQYSSSDKKKIKLFLKVYSY